MTIFTVLYILAFIAGMITELIAQVGERNIFQGGSK